MKKHQLRKYTAEALGTFALIFAGCGAIIVNQVNDGVPGHIGICIVFGLIIMSMIYSFGNVSGAHFNPAVTLAFMVDGRIKRKNAIYYIVFQIAGAIIAGLALYLIFPNAVSYGATNPSDGVMQAFVMEVILTLFLMTVILNVSTGHMEKGIMAGAAIGGYVALAALFGGPICGASMNPARSIGPAIVSGDFTNLWIYIIAPVIGAMLAVPISRFVQCCADFDEDQVKGKKCKTNKCDK